MFERLTIKFRGILMYFLNVDYVANNSVLNESERARQISYLQCYLYLKKRRILHTWRQNQPPYPHLHMHANNDCITDLFLTRHTKGTTATAAHNKSWLVHMHAFSTLNLWRNRKRQATGRNPSMMQCKNPCAQGSSTQETWLRHRRCHWQ